MFLGTNAALLGCQEYFNRCAAAGSPIGATQTPTAYDNAASFNGTSQFLSNASFTQGGSFTLAFWVNPRNANFNGIFNKGFQNGTAYDWQVFTIGSTVYLQGGTPSQTVNVNRPLTLNQWSFVVVTYDSSTLVKSISVNNGIASSNTGTGAMANSFSSINFSFIYNGSNSVEITAAGYWNRVLSPSEITSLWNNGAGRTYASLDSGLRTNLVSWWALNGTSTAVSLTDSHTGGNNLTNTGSVTAPNIGPVVTALSDPRQLIIDFAQGIDRLGLWNSMVCWPLRSSQNAGSGTTAFSLGGLGQFNGTLAGSTPPTWGANGVNFAGTAQMTTSFGLTAGVFSNLSQMVAYDKASWSPNEFLAGTRSVIGNDFAPGIAIGSDSATTLRLKLATTAFNSGGLGTPFAQMAGRHIVSIYKESVSMMGLIDGGAIFSGPLNYGAYSVTSPTASNFAIGPSFGGMVSVALLYTGNNFPASNIHNLYRQTLGLGLGLP
jgi:hypothetical protein